MNPVKDLSDEDLASLCAEQLPYLTQAYKELLRRYEPVVLRTCERYLRNRQEAEEACQDVFMRLFAKISQFEGRASFRTWLFRVVFNICATRRKKFQKQSWMEGEEYNVQDPASTSTAAPEGGVGDRLEVALNHLSASDREILLLRFEAELSLEEIAGVLGLKLSAVKMRLYRAMDRLKQCYSDGTTARAPAKKKKSD